MLFGQILRRVVLAGAVIATGSSVFGQDDNDQIQIVIDSRPPGAAIYLEGAYTIVGRTPLRVNRPLIGPYKIRSWKYGFEEFSSEVQFTGRGGTMMIKLRRKTPLKAGLRSIIFPGWGQMYTQQRTKGILISVLQLGTVVAAISAHSDFLQTREVYNAALEDFIRLQKDFSQRQELLAEVRQRERDMNRAYDRRRRWLWITGSVWVFNILDATLFFPRDYSKFYDMRLSRISASVRRDEARVNFAVSF